MTKTIQHTNKSFIFTSTGMGMPLCHGLNHCTEVNLGAGFDTLYFWLRDASRWRDDLIYFEVDFPEVLGHLVKIIEGASGMLSFFSLFLLIVGTLAVECCFCWFHGLLHWNRTAESEQIGEAAHRAVEIGAWKFIMEQKSRILARLDFRSARAYLIANVLCSRYMSAFSTSLSSINTWYDTMSRIQLINEHHAMGVELATKNYGIAAQI